MPHLREISIEGLFGLYDHTLELRDNPPLTIVAGPNGIGKTTLLRLCTALLTGGYRDLTRHEFDRLSVRSDTDVTIEALRLESKSTDSNDADILLRRKRPRAKVQETRLRISLRDPRLPPSIEQHTPDTYIDVRDGELIPAEEIEMRFGDRDDRTRDTIGPPWFEEEEWGVDFIETKRLDTIIPRRRGVRWSRATNAPIERYLSVVARTLEGSRRESARIHQARTSTVPRRLFSEYSRKNVNIERLRERYAHVERHAGVLAANGLLSDSLEALPDEKLNPTQKRFFEMFLDDFDAKLAPLDPVSAKIDQLRAIVTHKFLNKHLEINSEQGIVFVTEPHGTQISAESLSSGEQHELALISRLLFDEAPGTTVLIDEPELSLHVSWQHEMVEDLLEIARVADISFLLATHSTAIINGRWDIVEELGSLDPDRSTVTGAD